jgi:hypothetical protein
VKKLFLGVLRWASLLLFYSRKVKAAFEQNELN